MPSYSKKEDFTPKIAIDLMGSDNAPHSLLQACLIEDFKNIKFVFIGTKELEHFSIPKKDSFVTAKNFITMEENPLLAIRRKKDSSIGIGMRLLKEKKVDAFVSAGSSGALMSLGKMKLPMLKNISRPALLALLPSKKKTLAVLDVGANLSSKPKYLMGYALLGAAFQKTQGIKKPLVGLLNIGSEAKKGTAEVQKAYIEISLLAKKRNSFEFAGNIEGKEVFDGNIDVLVTDGFTGNVFLKTSEGIVNFILDRLQECGNKCESTENYFSDIKNYLHYQKYPGALLCGLDAIVIKCHSYCSIPSFITAIKGAEHFIKQDLISSIKKYLI